MDSTSVSLLRRLREPTADAAWRRFVEIYAPLIYHWGTQSGLNSTDAPDLVQEVLTTLVSWLPKFEYDARKRFRGWLRTVTMNKVHDFHRRKSSDPLGTHATATLQQLPAATPADLFEEVEYRSFLVKRALRVMQTEFPEHAWQACWKLVVEGQPGSAVAAELGMTENAVYVAKCRVMRR